jgi:prevent-host-death family protein
MSDPISTAEARDRFSEVLNRAAFGKERVVLTRRGKPLAAVVPIEDVEALEAMEDAADIAEARIRYEEWERDGRPGISLEELAARHGIDLIPAARNTDS